MKKIYTILVILLITGYVSAQTLKNYQQIPDNKILKLDSKQQKSLDEATKILKKNSKANNPYMYSYAEAWVDSLWPDNPGFGLGGGYMFPDTLIRLQYINGLFGPEIHGISVMLDPHASIFKTNAIEGNSNYKIDSVIFPMHYERSEKLDMDVADTIIIQVVTGYVAPVMALADQGTQAAYGVDTLKYLDMQYYPNSLMINQFKLDSLYDKMKIKRAKVYTYKHLLTPLDTVEILNLLGVATPDITADDGMVAVHLVFKPGYSYTMKDTLRQKNWMMFFSYQERGANKYPYYVPGDWNSSYIIPKWTRDPNPNVSFGWYGYFTPSWIYPSSYLYNNHWIRVKITPNASIRENENKTLILGQNEPNPAGTQTIINYELKENSKVKFTVSDMTGREIIAINQGLKSIGKHSININTSGLSNGIYYYTLISDNSKLTRKMIISK